MRAIFTETGIICTKLFVALLSIFDSECKSWLYLSYAFHTEMLYDNTGGKGPTCLSYRTTPTD